MAGCEGVVERVGLLRVRRSGSAKGGLISDIRGRFSTEYNSTSLGYLNPNVNFQQNTIVQALDI